MTLAPISTIYGVTADCGEPPWQRTWRVAKGEPEASVEQRIAPCMFEEHALGLSTVSSLAARIRGPVQTSASG